MKPSYHTASPAAKVSRASWVTQMAAPVLVGSILLLAACSTPRESHRVSAPPPVAPTQSATTARTQIANNPQYVTTSSAVPGTNLVVVHQQPPAAPVEAVVAQPSASHVWTGGYWTWRNERYEWMAGHWEIPPHRGADWINPRWERDGNAYRFYEGYWK